MKNAFSAAFRAVASQRAAADIGRASNIAMTLPLAGAVLAAGTPARIAACIKLHQLFQKPSLPRRGGELAAGFPIVVYVTFPAFPAVYRCSMTQDLLDDLADPDVALRPVTLDDKWDRDDTAVLITGSQAIVRTLLSQSALDRAAGFKTAGFVSGYRGSPLGGLDTVLWSMKGRLEAADVRFAPGLNEELAATAISGSQQVGLLPHPKVDGVFGAWYGKGPGVDRALDALKHGNYRGASERGGVVCFYGDDHAGKSSTVAHQSEQAMASCMIPTLYPADVGEIHRFGLLGFALSRFSGAWVGVKCVNETVEQTMTVDLGLGRFSVVLPDGPAAPPEGVHARYGPFNPARDEEIALEHRLPRVQAFVRANNIDRVEFRSSRPQLGIVTAGKSYNDVRQALALLELGDADAQALGISLYKVGCTWPLETSGLIQFADAHPALLVVEEKRSFVEQQAAAALVNIENRPRIYGKRDEDGAALLSQTGLLEPVAVARAIVGRLARLGLPVEALATRLEVFQGLSTAPSSTRRSPYFCSGCPHNRSTQLPEGSLSMTGIGCHGMANFVRPSEALPAMQMGGEGASWFGMAPFSGVDHIFQNLGDGTYYHSGLLAIRAAVAAQVNITYKILYNDAVAMTGGQPVDGPLSVGRMTQQLLAEGVRQVVIVTDDPARYAGAQDIPKGVEVRHRDDLDAVQRSLRTMQGATALIYEQTCAAELRRRRKRGKLPDPPQRLFIATAVCEGCGDCSTQSTCVSLQPAPTALGTKRRIDQASCNKDMSCLNGFCPSFITVRNAEPKAAAVVQLDDAVFADLPSPHILSEASIMVAGIGGTGVVTAGAILGMAAHLEGKAASLYDMTGLAQKNGAVYSHVKIAPTSLGIATQRIGRGQADVLLAFDLVAALGLESAVTLSPAKTAVVLNADVTTTAAFQFNRSAVVDDHDLGMRLRAMARPDTVASVEAASLASMVLGDGVLTTTVLLGAASQAGRLPVSPAAVEAAIRMNGVAVDANLKAFRLGRLAVCDRRAVDALLAQQRPAVVAEPKTLDELVEFHSRRLSEYQSSSLAQRYRAFVQRVASREAEIAPGSERLAAVVALRYGVLLAYKDEYEVARLLTDRSLHEEIRRTFGREAKLAFNLAPPLLARRRSDGRPGKREISIRFWPLLWILARLRRLRGAWADPFSYTADRRLERQLIGDYEALVERVLATLAPDRIERAANLLDVIESVRGFGPVKAAAAEAYRRQIALEVAAFRTAALPTGLEAA